MITEANGPYPRGTERLPCKLALLSADLSGMTLSAFGTGVPFFEELRTDEQAAAAIASDKKVASGKVKFVCIEALGQTRFEYLTPSEIVEPAAH